MGDELDPMTEEAPILDPWVQKAASAKPKSKLGIVAIAAVCAGHVALVGAGAWLTMRYLSEAHAPAVAEAKPDPRVHDEVESKGDDHHPGDVVHVPLVAPPVQVGPSGSVPQETERREIGDVKVVELGVKVASLRQALAAEQAAARASGKDLLVMTTRAGCDPCAGVEKAIREEPMQKALSPVVVVKVDVEVFDKELDAMQMQHDAIPGFFLLGPDTSPRDAIHGGEWEADIAENIAPVLGPFVRGQYTKRKNEWKKPMPHGVFL